MGYHVTHVDHNPSWFFRYYAKSTMIIVGLLFAYSKPMVVHVLLSEKLVTIIDSLSTRYLSERPVHMCALYAKCALSVVIGLCTLCADAPYRPEIAVIRYST